MSHIFPINAVPLPSASLKYSHKKCIIAIKNSHRTVNGPVNLTLNYSLKLLFFSNVQYKNRGPFVIVFIKDSDIGIDKESISRLFTKFASRSFQGTGLGLHLSKNMIKAHGGIQGVVTISMVRRHV
jgi:signal transduction histidine kinase